MSIFILFQYVTEYEHLVSGIFNSFEEAKNAGDDLIKKYPALSTNLGIDIEEWSFGSHVRDNFWYKTGNEDWK